MYEKDSKKHGISQGDLFQDFNYVRWAELIEGNIETDEIEIETDEIEIPFFVVLTQSCDLEKDFLVLLFSGTVQFSSDKWIILFQKLFNLEIEI